MRRRERFANVTWLKRLDGDGPNDQPPPQATVSDSVVGLLEMLTHRFGYLVEVEKHLSVYYVRLLPVHERVPVGSPSVAASYSGTDLRHILAIAWGEIARLRNTRLKFTISTREHIRWVA